MTIYDNVWQFITMYAYVMTMHEYVWLCITLYDYVWLCMTIYDYVWQYVTMCDYVWLCITIMPKYDNIPLF